MPSRNDVWQENKNKGREAIRMKYRQQTTILFLSFGESLLGQSAATAFNAVSGRMGLAWQASSSELPPLTGDPASASDDLGREDRVILVGEEEALRSLREQFSTLAEKSEVWAVEHPPVPALIEREVMGLVARLLGGGERQESQPTEAPAAEPPTPKEPAKLILATNPKRVVILDGRTFSKAAQVADLLGAGREIGQVPFVIECTCADDVARGRLAQDAATGKHPAGNRNAELYAAVRARAEPLTVPRLTLDTGLLTPEECLLVPLSIFDSGEGSLCSSYGHLRRL
jgi:hypothetical protein